MGISNYDYVFILVNIFGLYILRKFMECFFDIEGVDKKQEGALYLVYFVVMMAAHFFINKPIAFVIVNIAGFFMISLIYEGNLKRRILAVMSIYALQFGIECAVLALNMHTNLKLLENNNYTGIFGLICIKLISYIAALLLNNLKNIKRSSQTKISAVYWLSSIFVPLMSMYVMFVILNADGIPYYRIFLCTLCLIVVNYSMVQLHDIMVARFEEKLKRTSMEEQNRYYYKQLELMQASLKSTRMLEHDMKNHLMIIAALAQSHKEEKLERYLMKIGHQEKSGAREYAASGNIVIDSIINFKAQEARQNGNEVHTEIKVSKQIDVNDHDMTGILGNLLDNAVTAAAKVEGGTVDIDIRQQDYSLVIKIGNSFNGEISREKKRFISTKTDKGKHGIGLSSVESAVVKYNGKLEITYTDNYFTAEVFLYID